MTVDFHPFRHLLELSTGAMPTGFQLHGQVAAGFTHKFKDLNSPPTEAYAKEIEGEGIEVEFLTDEFPCVNYFSTVRKESDIPRLVQTAKSLPCTSWNLSLSAEHEIDQAASSAFRRGKTQSLLSVGVRHKAIKRSRKRRTAGDTPALSRF